MQHLNKLFLSKLIWIVSTGIGLILALKILPYQIDDAYITYRYSQNFILDGVFSFNHTGEPVEGFSSQLWFWLGVAWGHVFGVNAIHWAGVFLGTASYIAVVYLYYCCVLPGTIAGAFLASLMALTTSFIIYAVTGLESVLFVLLVCIFALSLIGKLGKPAGYIAAFLACWTRPEAPWLLIMLVIMLLLSPKHSRMRAYQGYVLALLLGCASLLCYRWHIFHELLPNTYFEKEASYMAGLQYLQKALSTPWFISLVLAATVSVCSHKNTQARAVYFMACSWIVAGVLEGGDWMGNFRFFMPAMALFILSLYGYLETISTLYDLRWRGALVMFCLLLFVVFSVYNTVRSSKVTDNQLVMNNLEYHWIKNWLVSHQLNSIAAIDIGELGYSSVLEILDLGGLTDRYIAKLAGIHMDKTIPIDYVLKKKPDVVLIRLNNKLEGSNIKTADIMSTVEAGIIFDPEFQKHYAPVFITAPHYYRQPFYGIMVFLHKAISSEKVLDTVNITYENGIPFVYFEPIDQLFIKNK